MGKLVLRIGLVLLVVVVAAIGWTFLPVRLEVSEGPNYSVPVHSASRRADPRVC